MTPFIGSEADLIQGYLAPLAKGFPGAFGLRDDAALLTPPPGHDLVVTMDAVAAMTHFFPDDAPADIGWKALAVNVSDLLAKGATPHAYLMSLAFQETPTHDWLAAFAAGLAQAQDAFGLALVGGDTDRRPGPTAITITAIGTLPTGTMVRRATARPGHHILVTGTLGDSALGLKVRRGDADARDWQLVEANRRYLVGRYLRPQPPIAAVELIRQHACCAMDISDGLLKDLGRMCQVSGIGAHIDVARLPLSRPAAQVLAADPGALSSILAGGDDYEVLLTVPAETVPAIIADGAALGVGLTAIGICLPDGAVTCARPDGALVTLDTLGYDHF
jgi:thiamine-monophosphate kinase